MPDRVLIGIAGALCIAQGAIAVAPSLTQIIPRGAARGTTVEILFQGSNLQDAVDLLFHDGGIALVELKAESASQTRCTLAIAADCSLGTHAIRLRTATGISNLYLFSVGNLKEVSETEPNNDAAGAQAIELNTTVNGVAANEDVDYYAVELAEGARLAVEVEAIRLGGALFDVKVRLFGPTGHELVAEDDTALFQQDAGFVYVAHEAGRHLIAVSEASYGGATNFYYRLHVGQFPRPLSATPLGGVPGRSTTVTWLGDPAIGKQTITLPADLPGTRTIVAKTELGQAPTDMPFRLSPYPGVLETEPNNQASEATPGAAPGAFDGVIETPGDVDYYRFEGKQGQRLEVRVWARSLGSPLDSVLQVLKPDGGSLASDDDGAGMDSLVRITLPQDGVYTLLVRDHLYRGGPLFAYRVEATPIEPSLKLAFLENDSVSLAVPRGNRAFLLLSATRREFDGPLDIEFQGLPEHVTAEVGVLPKGQTNIPVILHAAEDAALAGGLVGVEAAFASEGGAVRGSLDQDIVLVYGANKTVFQTRNVTRVAAAVTERAPFSIEVVKPKVPIVRGSYHIVKVVAHRDEGFDAAIDLRVPWKPPNVAAGTAQIPAGATEAELRIEANGGAALGTMNLIVVGSAANYTVCSSFTPMDISAPWVTFKPTNTEIEQGQTKEIVVALEQKQAYDGEYEAVLAMLPRGVKSTPQRFSAGTTELRFPLVAAGNSPPGKHNSLYVLTTIMRDGEKVPHGSGGATLSIFKPLPPQLKKPPAPPKAAKPKPDEPDKPVRKTRFPKS